MPTATQNERGDDDRILLGLLESVERDGAQSQRHLASELGIALGLVNAYLKRCVKKGLVKVSEAPTRRYAYYLTPQGFAEKSRLTVDYLSHSFSFFRRARADCAEALSLAESKGWSRVALAGASDLAEIARICAIETKLNLVGVVDSRIETPAFIGLPVFRSFEALPADCDGVVVTDSRNARDTLALAAAHIGVDRVITPKLLGVVTAKPEGLVL